jgi:hypothetical protein
LSDFDDRVLSRIREPKRDKITEDKRIASRGTP